MILDTSQMLSPTLGEIPMSAPADQDHRLPTQEAELTSGQTVHRTHKPRQNVGEQGRIRIPTIV